MSTAPPNCRIHIVFRYTWIICQIDNMLIHRTDLNKCRKISITVTIVELINYKIT